MKAKLASYGWSDKTLATFGIGGVSSYADYLKKMEESGYTRQFLHEIALDDTRIFNPNCLVYSVKDEHGNTVGFSARNLTYDAAVAEAKAAAEQYGNDFKLAKDLREAVPAKYVNSIQSDSKTGEIRNPIYQKGRHLFGIHTRKQSKSIYVFEGNADVVTAFNAGLTNSAGICSNKFTKEHLDLILELGINHLIFVMDGDGGGQAGVDAFLKLLETELSNRPGLRVELVLLKDGHDPDSFIRAHGLNAFLSLKKSSLFYWKMKQAIEGHEDKLVVAEEGVGLIVNELDPIQRFNMTEQLATATGVPYEVLNTKVQQIVAAVGYNNEVQVQALAERVSQQLKKSPKSALQILSSAQVELSRFAQQSKVVTTQSIVSVLDDCFEKFESVQEEVGLKTGWPLFDLWFGGIPMGAAFLTVPGKPNSGKSSWLSNVTYRVLDNNEDAIVLSHTIDDAFRAYLARLLACKYKYPSKYFQVAGKFLKQDEGFRKIFYEARQWGRDMIESERLIPLDVTMLTRTLPALEAKVRSIRIQYPSRPIMVVSDNFHLYADGTGSPDGEAKTRNLSMAFKELVNTYDVALLATMELPKGALKPGDRPRMINIKGTAGIAYDSNANIGVYNDMKDFREESQLVWKDKDDKIKPVVELVFDKSKLLNGFDGNIYYRFYGESGHFEEIPETEQEQWAAKAGAEGRERDYPAARAGVWDRRPAPPQNRSGTRAFMLGGVARPTGHGP